MLATSIDVLGLVNVRIPMAGASLAGQLAVSRRCRGLVVFAHGSGSSRLSPRNQYAARALARGGFGTLLLDLLTPDQAERPDAACDIARLADRLIAATLWLRLQRHTAELPMGYFGVGTGAAAALVASVHAGREIGAIVCRGGRPDLAARWLPAVSAPTLLIAGGRDAPIIASNRLAQRALRVTAELVTVPGATHLFEELGALEEVVRLATAWFGRYLGGLPGVEPACPVPSGRLHHVFRAGSA